MQLIIENPVFVVIAGEMYCKVGKAPEMQLDVAIPTTSAKKPEQVIVNDVPEAKKEVKAETKAEPAKEAPARRGRATTAAAEPEAESTELDWKTLKAGQKVMVSNNNYENWAWEAQNFIATVTENQPTMKALVIEPADLMTDDGQAEEELELEYSDQKLGIKIEVLNFKV